MSQTCCSDVTSAAARPAGELPIVVEQVAFGRKP